MGSESYAELHCHSQFSFLDGASTPEALAAEAMRLELSALALTDHNDGTEVGFTQRFAHRIDCGFVNGKLVSRTNHGPSARGCGYGGGKQIESWLTDVIEFHKANLMPKAARAGACGSLGLIPMMLLGVRPCL